MPFKRFLRAFKIHSRTRQPMYWVANNQSTFSRIIRYINSRTCNFRIEVFDPNYSDGITLDDFFYDSIFDDYED